MNALQHNINPELTTQNQLAANDVHTPAGQQAIDAMRIMLGRNSAASRYNKLTDQQKAIILFGARLKPSTHINTQLEQMTFDEREQIRASIIALCSLSHTFGEVMLSREQFNPPRKTRSPSLVQQ